MRTAGFEKQSATSIAQLVERVGLLEAVIDNFPGGILLFDRDLRLVLCNAQQKQLLDYPDSLFQDGPPSLEHIFRFNAARGEYGDGDPEEQVRHRMELVRQRRIHTFERQRPNGTILEIRGVPLAEGGFVTTYLDVTEQRRSQALIAHMAHHDLLTDLPNRALLLDRLHQALARVKRGENLALHYLDLDGFKPVNDTHGHAAGDGLLCAVAARLKALVRESDTAARIGGDEFVILQTGIGRLRDAETLARRIIQSFSQPFDIAGKSIAVGVSAGVAVSPHDSTDGETLLRMADGALYRCKKQGGGRYLLHARPEPRRKAAG